LKPQNIVLDFAAPGAIPIAKLVDFGLATVIKPGGTLIDACGTPTYLAPEMFLKTGYTEQIDMWSLGVITYMLYVLPSMTP
jgi:calcium/calmodulin-dependent protein kinase I